jgi:hypothetical protein
MNWAGGFDLFGEQSVSKAFVVWIGALLLCSLASGCGSETTAENSPQPGELTDLGQAYRLYLDQKKAPPSSPADLRPFSAGFPLLSRVFTDNRYTVIWGINLNVVPGPAERMLAYEADAANIGGWVLMADGSVKRLTAEDFKATRKAQDK